MELREVGPIEHEPKRVEVEVAILPKKPIGHEEECDAGERENGGPLENDVSRARIHPVWITERHQEGHIMCLDEPDCWGQGEKDEEPENEGAIESQEPFGLGVGATLDIWLQSEPHANEFEDPWTVERDIVHSSKLGP